MGILDKAKNLAKNPKGVVKSLVSKEITSTLNEFGTVEKAAIALSTTGNPKDAELVHVQINPSDLNYEYEHTANFGSFNTSSITSDQQIEPSKPSLTNGSMNFTIYYDFYDEYYARSANGSGLSLNSVLSGSGFHLKNKDYSSLEKLILASRYDNYVIFKWGSFTTFGKLQLVHPHYTAFSPSGEPLKANAYVNITDVIDPDIGMSANAKNWYDNLSAVAGSSSFVSGALNKLGSTIKALR